MERHQKQSIRVFRQIREFLATNAPEVGLGSIGKMVERLGAIVTELDEQSRSQEVRQRQARGRTQEKRALARRLRREFLLPLSGAAKLNFPGNKALLTTFAMPQARDYQALISIAEAMAGAATEYRDAFVTSGLQEDFATRITTVAAELRAAISSQAVEVSKRASATAALRRAYAQGRDLVRVLDAMVAPRLEDQPQRLAEWTTLARFVPTGLDSGAQKVDAPPTGSPVEVPAAA
ncbi:MAG: hypothetical protein IPK85_04845 [Gemmatimonadetes bacterium]|nr:hypothetical protein [Gemmatimonadota bacterium]